MALKEKVKTHPAVTQVGLDLGKVPPQAVDIEEAVLGAIMLEKDALISVLDILRPESFYKESHQKPLRQTLTVDSLFWFFELE